MRVSSAETTADRRRPRRRTGRLGLAGALGLAGLAFGLPGAAAATPGPLAARSHPGPTAAVSMGDSYISGEAGRWQANSATLLTTGDVDGTDRAAYSCVLGYTLCDHDPARVYGASYATGCDRSNVAEIESAKLNVQRRVNLACSGAETINVLPTWDHGQSFKHQPPQTDDLAKLAASDDVKLIVVSIGGNDLGFAGILTTCFEDYALGSGPCEPSQQAVLNSHLPDVEQKVEKVLRDIRKTMAAAGYANADYRLVLQSYPAPFPVGSRIRYPETYTRLTTGGCPIYNTDSTWAHDVAVRQIAAMLELAAKAQGAEFLDLRGASAGHELCATSDEQAGSSNTLADPLPAAKAEWIRFLTTGATQGIVQESIHPNAYAQHALGGCLSMLASAKPGRYACSATPGRGIEGMVLTPAA
jgi:hypothetical protein